MLRPPNLPWSLKIPFDVRASALLAWVLIGAHAVAAEKPRLVVVPFVTGEGASDTATAKFTALMNEELKGRADAVELVAAPVMKAAPDKPGARKGPNPEALASLEVGRKAFDDLRFEDAVPALRKGIDLMLAEPGTADFESVQDALVKIAASNFRNGEEKEAKGALNELARLAPGFALPPGYPPVFQREFEKAQKRLDKQPRGQVVIEGPAGATAFIDGRDLGMVPATEESVPAGQHFVKVEGARGERFGQAIELKGALVKVKAMFGAPPDRAPVNLVANPNISATVDEGLPQRLGTYCKAAGAEYALFGIVYRVGDSQLSAGTALFHTKRAAVVALTTVTFDVDVLTANTESFKLADEVLKRTAAFGQPATLPLGLVTKKTQTVVVTRVEPKRDVNPTGDDLTVAAPDRKLKLPQQRQPQLQPQPQPQPRVLENTATLVDVDDQAVVDPTPPPAPAEAKKGVPAWVWVIVGVGVAGGAAAGGYFGIREATRPVTGTVTASW